MRAGLRVALACALAGSGCVYYNAMWSAERFAGAARRLEADGREADARLEWARAAVKAESVIARHARSRWADAALVLRAEGLARSGNCTAAAPAIAKALAQVGAAALRQRAALAAARCPGRAEPPLGEALASDDPRIRSQAEYLAGVAAAGRLDHDAALRHFRAAREPGAPAGRARALLAAGRPREAAAVLDTLARARFQEPEWTALLTELGAAPEDGGGPLGASAALDRMLRRGRVPQAARVRLLLADGDRLLAAGLLEPAAARFDQAHAAAPVGPDMDRARARQLRVRAVQAPRLDALTPLAAELSRLNSPDARSLLALVARITEAPATTGDAFRAAEVARDSLGAPPLAGQMFLDVAAGDSGSLFAPKALVAALSLLPARRDSILGILDAVYGASPYTRALRGDPAPGYAAAEDSLARVLGVQLARAPLGAATRIAPPAPGPKGPGLDEAPARMEGAASPQRPGMRQRPATPDRRQPVPRPARP